MIVLKAFKDLGVWQKPVSKVNAKIGAVLKVCKQMTK